MQNRIAPVTFILCWVLDILVASFRCFVTVPGTLLSLLCLVSEGARMRINRPMVCAIAAPQFMDKEIVPSSFSRYLLSIYSVKPCDVTSEKSIVVKFYQLFLFPDIYWYLLTSTDSWQRW